MDEYKKFEKRDLVVLRSKQMQQLVKTMAEKNDDAREKNRQLLMRRHGLSESQVETIDSRLMNAANLTACVILAFVTWLAWKVGRWCWEGVFGDGEDGKEDAEGDGGMSE